jgi:hypothetical protein
VSGAETEILRIETEERYRPLTLERAHWLLADPEARRLINPRSGKAAICRPTFSLTDEEGRTVRRYELVRPTRTERHRQDLFAETHWTDADRASFDKPGRPNATRWPRRRARRSSIWSRACCSGLGKAARRSCPGLAADER